MQILLTCSSPLAPGQSQSSPWTWPASSPPAPSSGPPSASSSRGPRDQSCRRSDLAWQMGWRSCKGRSNNAVRAIFYFYGNSIFALTWNLSKALAASLPCEFGGLVMVSTFWIRIVIIGLMRGEDIYPFYFFLVPTSYTCLFSSVNVVMFWISWHKYWQKGFRLDLS